MNEIKSLAMIKMEKNFVAHVDKDYSRQPYLHYPVQNIEDPWNSLIGFVRREMEELELALTQLLAHQVTSKRADLDFAEAAKSFIPETIHEAMLEVGDVSNTLDFLFEGLLMELKSSNQKVQEK